jgi:hypothetical protein
LGASVMRVFAFLTAVLLAFLSVPGTAVATVNVHVNLSNQTMRVTSRTGEGYVWAISSGRRGYVTPRGVYSAKRLARMHYSRKYDNAPMPHSIFFRGGYAIHGTNAVGALGRPASHGCIRLAPGNAARLFAMVREQGGARIAISGAPAHASPAKVRPRPPIAYAAQPRLRADRTSQGWFADTTWR